MRPRPLHIAIVDDESGFRRALVRLLKAHGLDAVPFATGEALLAGVATSDFDCILLDLHMPGVSGFDVLESLRARPNTPPVIVVTGHDDPDCARRAFELAAFDCQRKPVRASDLIDAIRRACAP